MRPSLATLLPVVAALAMAPAAGAESFVATTPGTTTFTVPAGVRSLQVSATGGAGGDVRNGGGTTLVSGGRGAVVTGTVAVFAGEQLQLTVAGNGGNANSGAGTNGAGGAPDGGIGGYSAGGGGGATRILSCEGIACPVAVIAAGGGGGGMNGYIASGTFPVLAGGPGGAAGFRGGDGLSDTTLAGGSGGEPGTAVGGGSGGPGSVAGGDGSSPAGGAGGNQTATFNFKEGGGGGGAGVCGGGGGGAGFSGMDGSLSQAYAAGGGGGGGSSLAPSGGAVATAAPGAAPGIVLSWTPDPGPAPDPAAAPAPAPGSAVVAAVGNLTLSPHAFPAAPRGAGLTTERRYGAKVDYALNQAATVSFTVLQPRPGHRATGGRCVKPTRANRHAKACTRLALLPGSFSRAGGAGANSFRFTGRLAGRRLTPGSYRLVATPSGGRAVSAAFRITR